MTQVWLFRSAVMYGFLSALACVRLSMYSQAPTAARAMSGSHIRPA